MRLADVKTVYPDRDIDDLHADASRFCAWLSRQSWFDGNIVANEGGWRSFTYTAMLYGLSRDNFSKGLRDYQRELISVYRRDDERKDLESLFEDDDFFSLIEGVGGPPVPSVESQVLSNLDSDLDIVPLREAKLSGAAFGAPLASESYALHRNVLTDIFCPPFSDDGLDALVAWANTRSYEDAAELMKCKPREIRSLVNASYQISRKAASIEEAANRRRNPNAHTRYHKEEPSRWCYWCS